MRALAAGAVCLAVLAGIVVAVLAVWTPWESTPSPPYEMQPVAQAPAAAVDAALHEAIKGYVGLSADPEGGVRLTLSDVGSFGDAPKVAREAWTKVVREDGRDLPRFSMVEAAAEPEDLNAAFTKMRDVLTLPNAVFLDLDEACGCITVGIATAATAAEVASFATAHGVSQGVVKTAVMPRSSACSNSRMSSGPPWVECRFSLNRTSSTWDLRLARSACRSGPSPANLRLSDRFALHGCAQGAVDHPLLAKRRRPERRRQDRRETLDLALFDCEANPRCPTGRQCRFSDTAFADYDEDTLGITGRIARPSSTVHSAGTSCPLSVARSTDDIRMVAGISGLMTGDLVEKVGRTSGWTRGAITRHVRRFQFVDTDAAQGNAVDTKITMLCQYIVNTTALGGDSSGPVFQFSPKTGNGMFAGILWGGSANPTTATTMVFSPLTGIDQELGSFVSNQYGVASPFRSNGRFCTSNVDDQLEVTVEDNAVPAGEVEFVLNAGPGIDQTTTDRARRGPDSRNRPMDHRSEEQRGHRQERALPVPASGRAARVS